MSEFVRLLNGLNLIAKYDQCPEVWTEIFLISVSDHMGMILSSMPEDERNQMRDWGWKYQFPSNGLDNFWEFQLGDENTDG